jgi:hypothetical protein
VSTVDNARVGAWTPETNYDYNAWVTIVAASYTVRIPLASWADSGPPGTPDVPEHLGVARDLLLAQFPGADCTGVPVSAPLAFDGSGKRVPGIRNVVMVPVAGTRNVRYYDASQVEITGDGTANSTAYYDPGTGQFICEPGLTYPFGLGGIGALLFESSSLPPEPFRIQ